MALIIGSAENKLNTWIRNPKWLQFPPDDGSDDKCYALYAVFEDEEDDVTIGYQNLSQIDWGDGTIDTLVVQLTTQTITHTYDYSTLPGPILTYEDGRNYKQVMVEITCDNSAQRTYMQFGGGTSVQSYNILDCDVRFLGTSFGTNDANSYHIRWGVRQRPIYLERVKAKYPMNSLEFTRGLTRAIRLSKLDVHPDFFNYINAGGNSRCFDAMGLYAKTPPIIPNINNSIITSSSRMGRNSGKFILQDFSLPNATAVSNIFLHSHIFKCGDINLPVATNLSSMFRGTVGSNHLVGGMGIINAPLATDLRMMFDFSLVPEVVFTDCSNVSLTTNMFDRTGNIRKLIMPRLTVGVDVSNNRLTEDAINDFFTSLGTANGSQTIDVSGNPGSSTCDTSIATNKGFTIIA